jgi:hypothetical protein
VLFPVIALILATGRADGMIGARNIGKKVYLSHFHEMHIAVFLHRVILMPWPIL